MLVTAFTAKVYSNIPNFSPDMLMINSGIGIGIVMLLFYFNWRALSLIQKDEELVKSADRIR
jgi:ABC-type Fe3+-siderophore transport system permease subunit